MKQIIEESFPTIKINQCFNIHLEVINTVKKSQAISFYSAEFNFGN